VARAGDVASAEGVCFAEKCTATTFVFTRNERRRNQTLQCKVCFLAPQTFFIALQPFAQ